MFKVSLYLDQSVRKLELLHRKGNHVGTCFVGRLDRQEGGASQTDDPTADMFEPSWPMTKSVNKSWKRIFCLFETMGYNK